MEELSLEDAWRTINPEQTRYSWYRRKKVGALLKGMPQISASRIDYAITSKGLCNQIHNTMYLNGINSDHSAFFIGFELQKLERGPGYWKLNTSHLQNTQFIELINNAIDQTIRDMTGSCVMDVWSQLKAVIKETAQCFCRKQASDDKIAISQLSEFISHQEDKLADLTEQELDLVETSKQELEELLNKKVYAAMFRSKARWYMEAEKCSKYFFSLERSRYNAKTSVAVFDEQNNLQDEPEKVLELQRKFYEQLYTADPDIVFDLPNKVIHTVTEDSAAASNDPFSEQEIAEAVKSLKNGSCPGSDGLPVEVYKVFWCKIRTVFQQMVTYCYDNKTLLTSTSNNTVKYRLQGGGEMHCK